MEIQFQALTASDAECVFDLYRQVAATSPHGFLSEKSMDEIRAILDCARYSASVGAWHDSRLVAYALCALETNEVFLQCPLIRLVQGRGELLWSGKGTVVDPQFEGRLLMPRLLARRYELIREHSATCHSAGMIAVDNIPSLVGALRAGSWAVGLEEDQYCCNFVCYGGALAQLVNFGEQCAVAIEDIDGLSAKFASGWVGTSVTFERGSGRRQLNLRQALIAGEPLR